MKTKKTTPKSFYETKWFKLTCLFGFFGWLLYMNYGSFQIDAGELVELKGTVHGECKSGGSKDPIKIYFGTKEHNSRFGIYVGGTFGRWTAVKESLAPGSRITFKIYRDNLKKLSDKTEVILIYYLKTENSGLVFDERMFNEGEKSSDNRVFWALVVCFCFSLWGILRH